MLKLAIIGTAGRFQTELQQLSEEKMIWMKGTVRNFIREKLNCETSQIILVSGGSAWADHVAVRLYLDGDFAGLNLYLPVAFDHTKKSFDAFYIEGRRLNELHQAYQYKTRSFSLLELSEVISDEKVCVTVKRGFKQRNTLVAHNQDYLIAFTFGKNEIKEGGTKDTWDKSPHDRKIHFSLQDSI